MGNAPNGCRVVLKLVGALPKRSGHLHLFVNDCGRGNPKFHANSLHGVEVWMMDDGDEDAAQTQPHGQHVRVKSTNSGAWREVLHQLA